MTYRVELEGHRRRLVEIHSIMNSMKTLAFLETRKLSRFMESQQAVVSSITDVAKDFLFFFPETLPQVASVTEIHILVGSERGFCGDYNHAILDNLAVNDDNSGQDIHLVVVGNRLAALFEHDPRLAEVIDGASVAEEVPQTLENLVDALTRLQQSLGAVVLTCGHFAEDDKIQKRALLPFEFHSDVAPSFAFPPILNLSPQDFLVELTEHYLFSILHEILYSALMAENQHRLTHLDGALRHLDEQTDRLAERLNVLRQEEIIEEIEVILLSATGLEGQSSKPKI